MFFFNKKSFIVDYLVGLTDMHCHILPGIDDGAKNSDMSLEMLRQYTKLGYTGLIATPHIMKGFYDNTAEGVTGSFNQFQAFIKKNGYEDFSVSVGAEYMMDDGFDALVTKKEILPIVDNKVLVEMSYLQRSIKPFNQLFHLQQQGFEPILAHPERYSYLTTIPQILEYKKNGSSLQLNLLSLAGHYGSQSMRQAVALLENNHYDYLGTDAHHPGHFSVLKRLEVSKKLLPFFEALIDRTKENLS